MLAGCWIYWSDWRMRFYWIFISVYASWIGKRHGGEFSVSCGLLALEVWAPVLIRTSARREGEFVFRRSFMGGFFMC